MCIMSPLKLLRDDRVLASVIHYFPKKKNLDNNPLYQVLFSKHTFPFDLKRCIK